MFRGAFKYRRCVIPASDFYEWTGAKGAKTPHYFTSRDGRPLAFAGLWDHWSGLDGGGDLPNATIIVGEPARQIGQTLQRAVVGFQTIVESRNSTSFAR